VARIGAHVPISVHGLGLLGEWARRAEPYLPSRELIDSGMF
jgi:hypothetical protein